jgi:hypothetical protein
MRVSEVLSTLGLKDYGTFNQKRVFSANRECSHRWHYRLLASFIVIIIISW